ncbi:MAG TPA: cyclic nucleotide-binding domain-containing protein [Terracidiphilus sp.]|jgi:CRP-like cAMP-binding protein
MAVEQRQNDFKGHHAAHFDPCAFIADPELLRALAERSAPVVCDAERVLFSQGEAPRGLYILQKGFVTLTMAARAPGLRGAEPAFSILSMPGSLLGLPGVAGNQPYTLTATAHAGAQVRFITRGDFGVLMQAEPAISLKILQVLAAEVRSARRAIF